ncbi:MAG TPA: CHAT domain-containing tetratricopeptide repeat protein [Acidimicrobiales bacterium]|nr:CHAT domain-containing tetratricopeptide repeat protein [Acidimicrobiales bacterium]
MSQIPYLGTEAVAEADAILALAEVDPPAARVSATRLLGRPGLEQSIAVVSVAERALGVALCHLHEIPAATTHLRRSLQLALLTELPGRVAEAQVSLARALFLGGATEAALDQIDRAKPMSQGVEAARLLGERAWMLQRLGQYEEALGQYCPAVSLLGAEGDACGHAQLLDRRGRLHASTGSFDLAEEDLEGARALYAGMCSRYGVARVTHNLGFTAARRGDVATALEHYDRAEEELAALGVPAVPDLLDRCEALLSARLVAEARHTAEVAATQLEAGGMDLDLAEARLVLGQTALLAGAPEEARHHATLAWRAFTRQVRPRWAALARYSSLRAAWMDGHSSPVALRAALDTAGELEGAGAAGPAQHAHLIAGRLALGLGRGEEAEEQLRIAAGFRTGGAADTRARAWHAQALLCRGAGNARGAEAALRLGSRAVAQCRATLGATDRRALAVAEGQELADLGVELALQSERPERVLAWAERRTSVVLPARTSPTAPDRAVSDHLTQLRHLVNEVERLDASGDDTRSLFHRQAILEKIISARIGLTSAGGEQPETARKQVRADQLVEALGRTALVEIVESAGQLHAVTLVDGDSELRLLGDAAEVRAEVAALRFALARLARGRSPAAPRAAATAAVRYTSERLEDVLIRPLSSLLGDRPLLVVPTPDLHALPWSVLASCQERPVSVCPSVALWSRMASQVTQPAPSPDEVVLVAGPDLPRAEAELSAIRAHHPRATSLSGSAASAARVGDAIDGAGLVHIAAQGEIRGDNPLFSSLRLHGGPLTVYDLEQLSRAPRRMVLSACDGGLSALHPGRGLCGLTAALLSIGTATVVAGVIPISPHSTPELMTSFHRRLTQGAGPAQALAGAQAEMAKGGSEARARTAGFVCFGAG